MVERVVIINTVALNGGDAAILEAVVAEARRSWGEEITVSVFDSQAQVAARYYPQHTFFAQLYPQLKASRHPLARLLPAKLRPMRGLLAAWLRARDQGALAGLLLDEQERRGLEIWAQADVIISTGGTYLRENYGLTARFFSFAMAEQLGKPLVLFTQSLGPFAQPENRAQIKRWLSGAARILLRDEASREHLLELGLSPSLMRVVPDAVFALTPDERLEARRQQPIPARGVRLAISLRSWPYFKRHDSEVGMALYRRAIIGLVERLVEEQDAQVLFLSTCQGIEEYWTNDAEVAHQVLEEMEPELRQRVEVDDGFHTPHELREILSGYDVVVATRMHMAIEALIVGTPVLPISYEFKTRELFEALGFGELVQDIEEVDAAGLIAAYEALVARLSKDRSELIEGVLSMARDARGVLDEVEL